jgi:RNA polymerase sigma-70 factor (ECF subfamily)
MDSQATWSARSGEDDATLECLRRGDPRAFDTLYRAYRPRVVAIVRRVLRDPMEAEDVAQEIFLSVLKSVQRFDGRARISTWLYRVALNRALNRLRDLVRRERLRSPSTESMRVVTDEIVDQVERSNQVRRAVDFLGPERRLLVTLRDIEGRSYDEIARIARLPAGTVKSRLHRARAELAERLKSWSAAAGREVA